MAPRGREDAHNPRTLPFDQWRARTTLASMNPGPDGVESMRQCQCDTAIYQVEEHHMSYDDFKLLKSGVPPSQSTGSPLLSLPKKVRMRIYAYVVTYPDAIPIREHTTTTARNNSIVRESWFFSPPLVRSCRKAEKDAAPLFYANNSFRAELTCGDTSTLLTWLVNISPRYLALVPKLIISLEMRSFFDIDNMRKDFECSGRTLPSTAVTSKCITNRGISADRILMVSPELKHLAKDARLLGRGVRDAETLRE